jgi:hypothetical protein
MGNRMGSLTVLTTALTSQGEPMTVRLVRRPLRARCGKQTPGMRPRLMLRLPCQARHLELAAVALVSRLIPSQPSR